LPRELPSRRLRRRRGIINLAAGDIDHELGELGGIAVVALSEVVRHLQVVA